MCGIAGVAFADGRPVDPALLQRMAGLLRHRGPDAEGLHRAPGVGLAHRRLAIIDREGGGQPMLDPSGRLVIVYNGEVYNFRELRAQLEERGHRFLTRTDTEVVLHAWQEWGVEALPRLNGMFALCVWDVARRELWLARDRLGIKPLYYARRGPDLAFASEIKGLLPALPQVRPCRRTIYEFLTFQNVLGDDTFFEGVAKLPPAHWLCWTPAGVRSGAWWEPRFDPLPLSFEQAVEEYRARLGRAVERHMIADVPVGAYLSSGVDSASVATMARRHVSGELHTFTGAFGDAPWYDERPGARRVAARIGATPHEVEITPQHYLDAIEDVVWHLDEPTLGTGALPQWVVARLASRAVKVVLTGHGSDECFAGYQVNKVALLRETWAGPRRRIFSALRAVRRDEWSRVLYYLLYPLLYPEVASGLFIMVPRARRRGFFAPELLEEQAGFEPLDRLQERGGPPNEPAGQRLTRFYLRTYLPTTLLQEDKLGMAHSLESRTPLCDNELVDLALGLPLSTKLHGGQLKAIPRAALREELPAGLLGLPKRGFPTPFARWFRRPPLRAHLEDLLLGRSLRERGLFAPRALERLLAANTASRTDGLRDYARANTLHSCSLIELWFRRFIDRAHELTAPPPGVV